VDVYRWRISQVGRRHGERAVELGVIMFVICVPLAGYRWRYTFDLAVCLVKWWGSDFKKFR